MALYYPDPVIAGILNSHSGLMEEISFIWQIRGYWSGRFYRNLRDQRIVNYHFQVAFLIGGRHFFEKWQKIDVHGWEKSKKSPEELIFHYPFRCSNTYWKYITGKTRLHRSWNAVTTSHPAFLEHLIYRQVNVILYSNLIHFHGIYNSVHASTFTPPYRYPAPIPAFPFIKP